MKKTIDTNDNELIRLNSNECNIVQEGDSFYVYTQLSLGEDIPSDSLLLFEIFGIKNPSTNQGNYF